jgi:hypothetical protein
MALILPLPNEIFLPFGANFPVYIKTATGGAERSAWGFSHTVSQVLRSASMPMPAFTGDLTFKALTACSATTGNMQFRVQVEAIASLDAINIDTTNSFDTANSSGSIAVAGTTFNPKEISITLTNRDSVAAGEYVIFRLDRDISVGSNVAATVALLSAGIYDAS